jgi:hypothetical protein
MKYNAIATALAVTVLGLLTAGTASAQRFDRRPDFGFDRVHGAARSIERNAHELHEEVDEHFRRSPSYRHLHSHTREIERLARAIHDVTDGRDRRGTLRRLVNELDREVHHFVEVVEDARNFRGVTERGYSHLRQEVRQLHRSVIALKRMID